MLLKGNWEMFSGQQLFEIFSIDCGTYDPCRRADFLQAAIRGLLLAIEVES